MDYVSTVVGTLRIDDLNVELGYMEVISLSQSDFKISPKLREAHRVGQIINYDPHKHRNAKRFSRFTKEQSHQSKQKQELNFSEILPIKDALEGLSDKMSNLVGRVTTLLTRQIEINEKLNDNFDKFFKHSETPKVDISPLIQHLEKMENSWSNRLTEKDEKIDLLLSKLDQFIEKSVNNQNFHKPHFNGNGNGSYNKASVFEDKVTFIPEINVQNVKTSVKSQEIRQEGTSDILAKLKALKNN